MGVLGFHVFDLYIRFGRGDFPCQVFAEKFDWDEPEDRFDDCADDNDPLRQF